MSNQTSLATLQKTRRFQLVLRCFLPLFAITLYLVVVVCTAWLCDDAFISFRTADNFVHGYGLTWNVQERVQSYTHPLWLLLFSSVYAFTHEPFYTGIFLTMAISLAAVGIFAWKIAATTMGAVLGVLVMTCSVAFVDYSTSGMENPLTHFILALFLWLFFSKTADKKSSLSEYNADTSPCTEALNTCNRRRLSIQVEPFLLSFLVSMAAVNRMDTVLLYIPSLVYVGWQKKSWQCLWSFVVGMFPLGAWMIFSLFYYGFAFPNTAYARFHSGVAIQALAAQGCYYLWDSLCRDPITLVTIASAIGFAFVRRYSRNVCVAFGILLYLLYILRIGGDFMSGRFLTAPFFAAVCLLGSLGWTSVKSWLPAISVVVILLLLSSRPLALHRDVFDLPLKERLGNVAANRGISDECAYYYAGTGLLRAWQTPKVPFPNFTWAAAARKVRDSIKEHNQPLVICTENIGIFGYYAGPDVHVVDHFALTDALLARLSPLPNPQWRVGHFKRAIPDGYMESLRTGTNRLQKAGLAKYYDHVALITKGSLWDPQRLITIWNINIGQYEFLLKQGGTE